MDRAVTSGMRSCFALHGTAQRLPRRMFATRPSLKQHVPSSDHARTRAAAPEKESLEAQNKSNSSKTYPSNISANKETWDSIMQLVKGTVLEAMARSIPKSDRHFFAQRWGFIKSDETPEEGKDTTKDMPGQATAATEAVVVEAKEKIQITAEEPPEPPSIIQAIPTVQADHPILGSLVVDMGYKRVYKSELSKLLQVPIWKKQRILRPERAKKIAASKLKGHTDGDALGLPGVITLYHDVATDKFGILDGQHRLGALVILSDKQAWAKDVQNIIVDVFETSGEGEVKNLFTEINSAEPLKLVDMPGDGAADDVRTVLAETADALAALYPDMFKASQRCRPPHVNKDNLRDDLFQNEVMQRHGIVNAAGLLEHIQGINNKIAKRPRKDWTPLNSRLSPDKASFDDALAKATKNCFFLGLDSNWMKW